MEKPIFISLALYTPLLVGPTVVPAGNDRSVLCIVSSRQIDDKFGANIGDNIAIFPELEFKKLGASLVVILSGANNIFVANGNLNYCSSGRTADEVYTRANAGAHCLRWKVGVLSS